MGNDTKKQGSGLNPSAAYWFLSRLLGIDYAELMLDIQKQDCLPIYLMSWVSFIEATSRAIDLAEIKESDLGYYRLMYELHEMRWQIFTTWPASPLKKTLDARYQKIARWFCDHYPAPWLAKSRAKTVDTVLRVTEKIEKKQKM